MSNQFLRRVRRIAKDPDAYNEYVQDWSSRILNMIFRIKEGSCRSYDHQLKTQAMMMLQRHELQDLGRSPAAWMERDILFGAMLLDFRVKMLKKEFAAPHHYIMEMIVGSLMALDLAEDDDPMMYAELSESDTKLAKKVLGFAGHWMNYLITLLIRPPGPLLPNEAFPTTASRPRPEVRELVTRMAHCRPAGAFFVDRLRNRWRPVGGRDTCRTPLFCPHCHARRVVKLVDRIQKGPWKIQSSSGKRLVFFRLTVGSDDLQLEEAVLQSEYQEMINLDQIRTSTEYYEEDPEVASDDEMMIQRYQTNLSVNSAMTRHELDKAASILRQAVRFLRSRDISGGIQVHSIGPRRRNFQHELSIVGEISADSAANLLDLISIPISTGMNLPVEILIFPSGQKNAVRTALADTSYKFDLSRRGIQMNSLAHERAYKDDIPMGFRGAFAWQPFFLFDSVSFWSMYFKMKETRHCMYRYFGTWKSECISEKKKMAINIFAPKDTHGQLLLCMRRYRIRQCYLAEQAGVSRSAISRLVKEYYGSETLKNRVFEIIQQRRQRQSESRPESCPIGLSGSDASKKLQMIGRSQKWLANQSGLSTSTVSRELRKLGGRGRVRESIRRVLAD